MTDAKRPLWTDLWELSTDFVTCKECQACQDMARREAAFNHEPHCSQVTAGMFPYRELLELLKMVHFSDVPLPASANVPVWKPPKN